MKRKLICLALALCISAIPAAQAPGVAQVQAAGVQGPSGEAPGSKGSKNVLENYEYNILEDGTVEIARYTGNDAKIAIPDSIDGKKVSRIGDSSFAECESLVSVEAPAGIAAVKDYAFYHCGSLEEVTFKDGLKRIGEHVFSGCGKLKNVGFPGNVEGIGWEAFAGCTSLEGVSLPKNLKTVDMGAFSGCKSLKRIALPEGAWYIGEAAFRGCTRLKALELPKSIKDISKNAFSGCNSLTDVYYAGNQAQRKKARVFGRGNECLLQAKVHYGNSSASETFAPKKGAVLTSGHERYKVKTKVSSVAFVKTANTGSQLAVPGNIEIDGIYYDVASVTANAFKNNKRVTKINIEGPVTSIGTNAFWGCIKLKTVIIRSDRLESVGKGAFSGTPGAIKVKVPLNQSGQYKKLLKGCGLGSRASIVEY